MLMAESSLTSAKSGESARSWNRLDGVDLLRGLAIFFVLMNHVNMRLLSAHVPYAKSLPKQLVSSLVWNGQRGVQIFFAVSGFLITSTTLRRWDSLSLVRVRAFYQMRFARIVPLLLALLVILSALHFAQVRHFIVPQRSGGLGRALIAALTFHVNVLEARRGYLPGNWDVLWSLSVEEMFYLFFPLILWRLGRGKLFISLLLAFVVLGPVGRTLVHGNEIWHEYSYFGSMDAISLGCLTALFVRKQLLSRAVVLALAATGTAVLGFSLGFSLQADSWGLAGNGLDMTLLAAGTCMLIAVAAQTHWRSPCLLSPLLKLGRHSYEIYLSHMFLVLALSQLFVAVGKPRSAVPALFLSVVFLSGLLGALIARFYSEPVNRWLRERWGDGASRLGSVVEPAEATPKREKARAMLR
jgi:peptidoglycan/LPS O-acetylase OafA/YrhL